MTHHTHAAAHDRTASRARWHRAIVPVVEALHRAGYRITSTAQFPRFIVPDHTSRKGNK